MAETLWRWVNNRKAFYVLLVLNALASLAVVYAFRNKIGGDRQTYLYLADSMRRGLYSFWWFLPDYIPDTFRNPGYPLFLLILTSISRATAFIQVVQLLMYFAAVGIVLRLLGKYSPGYVAKNIFLLILLPSFHIVFSAVGLMPDCCCVFLIALFVYLDEFSDSRLWWKYVAMGLVAGIVFQMRPVFLFFPFIKVLWDWFEQRRQFPMLKNFLLLAVFMLTTLPYGIWNYQNHGVFSITSLEGGGGVFHNGYWSFKIPGYTERRYWSGNAMSEEMISFVKPSDIPKNIVAYNREWDYIDSACAQYQTPRDSARIAMMEHDQELPDYNALCLTHNTRYTIAREKLLKKFVIEHYKRDLPFLFVTRLYTACRVWFTGFHPSDLKGRGAVGKLVVLYPFLTSVLVFLMALIFIPFAFAKRVIRLRNHSTVLLLLIYFCLIHVPFAIQARYTIPVRMLLIALLATAITELWKRQREQHTQTE